MVKAQEYFNEKYPKGGVCQRESDKENKGTEIAKITKLDISMGKVGGHWYAKGGDKILEGSLKLEGFTNLQTLIISSHELTELDVSDCSSLEVLDCQDNKKLANLNVNGCSNLKKIDCFNNADIKELDLSTCSNLEEVNISKCSEEIIKNKTAIKSELVLNTKKNKLVKGPVIISAQENDIRNILLVGWTGNGKSTLANTLINENEKFEEVFAEGKYGTSKTKGSQKNDEPFEWGGKKYCLIDNIGFGDTSNLSEEDILGRIADGIYSAREGINQILFVVKERFTEKHIKAFNLFEEFISDSSIAKFTTIVRTGFQGFRDLGTCENDRRVLINGNKELREIINSCNGIVHVDNPSTKAGNEQEININKEKRKKSREIVLNHLTKNCLDIYKLKEWDNIYSLIKRKKEIEQSLGNSDSVKKEKLNEEWNEVTKQIKFRLEADPLAHKAAIEIGYLSKKSR